MPWYAKRYHSSFGPDAIIFVQFGFGNRGDPGSHTCLVTAQVHSSAMFPAFRLLQRYSSSNLSHSV